LISLAFMRPVTPEVAGLSPVSLAIFAPVCINCLVRRAHAPSPRSQVCP
jgi:hypothetical protein